MAIKDKDGNVYKLRGPNPLMRNQQEWDRSKLKFINMGSTTEIVEDARNPVKKFKTEFNVVDIGEKLDLKPNKEANLVKAKDFIEEIAEPEEKVAIVAPPKEEPQEIKEGPVEFDVNPHLADIMKQRGVEFYCAPVIGHKQHVDELYDNSYKTFKYGEKSIFDAIVIDMSDFELQFWCVRPISEDSIIHPKTREKGQRWWRVREVEPKTGGYLCKAITSDSNPDFS